MQLASASTEETQQLAAGFVRGLKKGEVVALVGDLGSGKTTFVQGAARALGIKARVVSPTFILIRQYPIPVTSYKLQVTQLIHVDLYRVDGWEDVAGLGLEEIWSDPTNLVMIEWAEKIKEYLPKNMIWIEFEYTGEDESKREIRMLGAQSRNTGQSWF